MAPFSWRWPFKRADSARPYTIDTGSELYEQFSITGLNKLPVTIFSNYICAQAVVTAPSTEPAPGIEAMTLSEVTAHRLINGSFVWLNDGGWQLLDNLREVCRNKVVQLLEDVQLLGRTGKLTNVYRVYVRKPLYKEPENEALEQADLAGYQWVVTDIDAMTDKPVPNTVPRTLPDNALHVFDYGLGILYPNQWTYKRLEEIEVSMRKLQSGPGIKTLLHGFVRNPEGAKAELNSEDSTVSILPGELKVDRMTETSGTQALKTEFDILLALYFADMNITDTAYQPDRPVASDRYLTMGPMLRAVEEYRREIREIMSIWGMEVEYEKLYTMSVADRRMEYDMWVDAESRKFKTPEETKARLNNIL